MSNIDWGTPAEETPQTVAEALTSVHERGEKLKARRKTRAAIASSSLSLILVVALLSNIFAGHHSQSSAELAASVVNESNTALGNLHGLSYDFSISGSGFSNREANQTIGGSIRLRDDGSRWMSLGEGAQTRSRAYDAATNIVTDCSNDDGSCEKTIDPSTLNLAVVVSFDVAEFGAQLSAVSNLHAVKTTANGRPEWSLTGSNSKYSIKAQIDQNTYLVSSLTFKTESGVETFSVSNVRTNPQFSADAFVVDTGTKQVQEVDGSSPLVNNLSDVPNPTRTLLTASYMPSGFKLASTVMQLSGGEIDQVIVQTYRRGLQSYQVLTGLTNKPDQVYNPFITAISKAKSKPAQIVSGYFANARNAVLATVLPNQISDVSGTTLLVSKGNVLLAVNGELSVSEIVKVAGSVNIVQSTATM